MNFSLWKKLRKAKKDLQPSREFKRELWASLDKRWDEVHGPVVWYRILWVRTTGIIMSGFVGVASVGTAVYAYNSPEVTSGTPLYGVKQTLENIVEKTKTTPEAKAQYLLVKAERREEEKKIIAERLAAIVPAQVSTSSTSSTVQVEQENEHNDDVRKTEEAIHEVEFKLSELEKQLGDSKSDQEIKKQIQKHFEKKHEEEKEDDDREEFNFIVPTTTPATTTAPVFKREDDHGENERRQEDRGRGRRGRGTYIDLQNGTTSGYEFVTTTPDLSTSSLHWNLDDHEDTDNILRLLPTSSADQILPPVITSSTERVRYEDDGRVKKEDHKQEDKEDIEIKISP